MIEKVICYISSLKPIKLISLVTFCVLLASVPLVYLVSLIVGLEYSVFLFTLSIILPLLLTPPTIYVLIRLTIKLEHVKVHLQEEIQKNEAKDLMLFEQAKFVLMGEMLANISHQWKQPLNTINLALMNMKFSNDDNDSQEHYHEIIENNVNYLASTIDDFMSFFDKRSHTQIKALMDIVHEIDSIVKDHVENSSIDFQMSVDNSYADVEVTSSLSQVVINLINNAKDALDKQEHKEIKVYFKVSSSGLDIECCDNGNGIPPEIQERIFDPYFTTKDKKQGTGIGLYMSKQIILKIFDGDIRVVSKENLGYKTCFLVSIPYSEVCVKKEKPL